MCSWGRWVMRGGHERRVCSYGTGRCAWIAMDVRMVTTTEYTQERVPDGGRNGVHYLRSEIFAFSRGNHQLMEAKVAKAVNVEARFKSLKIYLYWGSRVSGGAGLETLMVNRKGKLSRSLTEKRVERFFIRFISHVDVDYTSTKSNKKSINCPEKEKIFPIPFWQLFNVSGGLIVQSLHLDIWSYHFFPREKSFSSSAC